MKLERQLFTVTRQSQWPEGTLIVEISQGSLDYANPGMLCVKYRNLGEGDTFTGMTDAVEAGIKIARQWAKDARTHIQIAVGCTGGNTLPFEGQRISAKVERELRAKAKDFDAKLPKCENCGEILGEQRYGDGYSGEYDCCSQYCAEQRYYAIEEEEEVW
jgi:hypothetical protein